MARLTRTEQSQRNRDKILASARSHFERSGYHAASVDAIAEEAGFSKGAIYSQFGSKDELMLAVLDVSIEQRQEATDRFLAASGPVGSLADLVADTMAMSQRTLAWQAALTEFRIHAWRNPELNRRYQELHERTVELVSTTIQRVLDQTGTETEIRPRELAVAGLVANTGLVVESLSSESLDWSRLALRIMPEAETEPTAH